MEVNKDIGNGIKDRLEDLNMTPDTMVWDKIEIDLKKKKKKRFAYFWFPLAGVSILALIFILFNTNGSINSKTNVTKGNKQTLSPKPELKTKDLNVISNNSNLNVNSTKIGNSNTTKNTQITTANNSITVSNSYYINNKTASNKNNTPYNNPKFGTNKNNTNIAYKTIPKQLSLNSSQELKNGNGNGNGNGNLKNTKKTDSLVNIKTKDSIPNENKLKEEKTSKKDSINTPELRRWSVLPFASIDQFSSFNHATTNNTSSNYGIKFNYLATEDLSLRIGVSKLNLNFTTNEDTFNFTEKISYIEIPLEIKQKLIKGKINTSIVAGISYLLLEDASIYTDGIPNNLGIDSIENTNMSINLGLSFDTLIINKLHFVIEPMFKYHFKPLENRLKSKTYTLSILGGLEYKF